MVIQGRLLSLEIKVLINKKSLTSKRMGIFLCSFQQNAGLNIFCQHTKKQKI